MRQKRFAEELPGEDMRGTSRTGETGEAAPTGSELEIDELLLTLWSVKHDGKDQCVVGGPAAPNGAPSQKAVDGSPPANHFYNAEHGEGRTRDEKFRRTE